MSDRRVLLKIILHQAMLALRPAVEHGTTYHILEPAVSTAVPLAAPAFSWDIIESVLVDTILHPVIAPLRETQALSTPTHPPSPEIKQVLTSLICPQGECLGQNVPVEEQFGKVSTCLCSDLVPQVYAGGPTNGTCLENQVRHSLGLRA